MTHKQWFNNKLHLHPVHEEGAIITDRHPNPLFSVCIISPNAERKIMQTKCVRKTGAVFFGGREIIRGNLTRAKLDTQHY